MSDGAPSGGKAGFLLVLFGLWLLGQTLVGGLVARLLGLAKSAGSSSSSGSSPTAPGDKPTGSVNPPTTPGGQPTVTVQPPIPPPGAPPGGGSFTVPIA